MRLTSITDPMNHPVTRTRTLIVCATTTLQPNTYLILDVDELSSRSFHAPIPDQNLSSLFLNEFVDCASITCCGNEFQLLQTC